MEHGLMSRGTPKRLTRPDVWKSFRMSFQPRGVESSIMYGRIFYLTHSFTKFIYLFIFCVRVRIYFHTTKYNIFNYMIFFIRI